MYTVIFALYSLFYYGTRELCFLLSKIVAFLIGLGVALFGTALYLLVLVSPFWFLIDSSASLQDKAIAIGALFLYVGFFHKLSIEESFWLFIGSFFLLYIVDILALKVLVDIFIVFAYVFLITLVYNLFLKEDPEEAFKLLTLE